ncbi:MAG: rhodanese-like domain-containing protein [Blastocatellales bacterium]
MKMISKLGGGALIAAMAISAVGCSKSGAATSPAGVVTATTPPANTAAPVPSSPQNPEDKMPRVGAEEAKKLLADGKAIIIDVRGTDAYKMSHIKGAIDVPLNKLESGDFKDMPKDKRIVAYCT